MREGGRQLRGQGRLQRTPRRDYSCPEEKRRFSFPLSATEQAETRAVLLEVYLQPSLTVPNQSGFPLCRLRSWAFLVQNQGKGNEGESQGGRWWGAGWKMRPKKERASCRTEAGVGCDEGAEDPRAEDPGAGGRQALQGAESEREPLEGPWEREKGFKTNFAVP